MKNNIKHRSINVFYGHFIVGILFTLFSLFAATQYVAHEFGYQPQLGSPIFIVYGYPIYNPLSWFFWAYKYNTYAPHVFDVASWITYGIFFTMFFIMIILAIRRAKNNRSHGVYGTARWASEKELDEYGLFENKGVVIAQTKDAKYSTSLDDNDNMVWIMNRAGKKLITHDGPEHVFCFAPTRSGKGVGLVIPTLVSWNHSTIVYDIKKELWTATSGWRSQFSYCWNFEPTAIEGSVSFNPLMEIRKGDYEVRDAQNVADILVDPDGSKERLNHWEKTGHSLLVGTILHVLYSEKEKNLAGVAKFLSNPDSGIFNTLNLMMNTNHTPDGVHPVVSGCAREMLNKSDNELSGVLSTAMSFLGLYRDPIIAKNTSKSDFSINDLMNSDKPVSLYLVIPPSDIERTKPLMRLMLNQIGRRLTERSIDYKPTHRLLMLLDEFPSLGRLGFFETELAYLAGYGIKCFMIAQSLNQIEKAYGPNNSILDNSHVRVTYGSLDERTAKRISDLLGQATETRRQMNFTGNRLAPWLGHIMSSEQDSPRALLTPGEILQLPGDDALVMIGGMPPYRAKKIMYYQDPRFKGRTFLKPPDPLKELLSIKHTSAWDTNLSSLNKNTSSSSDFESILIGAEPDQEDKEQEKTISKEIEIQNERKRVKAEKKEDKSKKLKIKLHDELSNSLNNEHQNIDKKQKQRVRNVQFINLEDDLPL